MGKERVAIVKVLEQHIDAALKQVLDLLGPLDDIVPRGSRVLIKPNFVFPPTDRGITHPELVEAVVRLVDRYARAVLSPWPHCGRAWQRAPPPTGELGGYFGPSRL